MIDSDSIVNEWIELLLFNFACSINRNKTITFKLMWDHMPITGRMYNGEETKSTFKLPGNYKN